MKSKFYPLQAAYNLERYIFKLNEQRPEMHFIKKDGQTPVPKRIAEYFEMDVRTIRKLLKGEENTCFKDSIFKDLEIRTGIVTDYWKGIIQAPVTTTEEAEKEKSINAAFDLMEERQAQERKKESEAQAAFFARIGFSYAASEYTTPDGIEDLHILYPIGHPEEAQELTNRELQSLLSSMSDLVEVILLRKRRTRTT